MLVGGGLNINRFFFFFFCVVSTYRGSTGLMNSLIRKKSSKMKHPNIHHRPETKPDLHQQQQQPTRHTDDIPSRQPTVLVCTTGCLHRQEPHLDVTLRHPVSEQSRLFRDWL